MKTAKGFTVTELLIVVALAGIVAAVVIPAMSRAFIASNEAATLGDIRTVIDAQDSYSSVNGGFYDSHLPCLTAPSSPLCIPGYPTNGPTFLDSSLAALTARHGYNRVYVGGPAPLNLPPTVSPTSARAYRYDATPVVTGVTGVRGFAGDASGRICFTPDGTPVPPGTPPESLPAGCAVVP